MMGIVIVSYTTAFDVDLGGLSADRKEARIRKNDVRSVVMDTDDITVELVFSSGEIYKFPYSSVDSVDGTAPTDQAHLYSLMNTVLGFN